MPDINSSDLFDVAIVGYGPTGATAANILGQAGLRVLVLERDADIYSRARAISVDDEILRSWQSVGLADSIQEHLLPGGTVSFVAHDGEPIFQAAAPSHECGHPAQQFIYQPQVDTALRAGVERFPNVEVRTGVEVLKVANSRPAADTGSTAKSSARADESDALSPHVEILAADLADDSFLRFHASWVIAADGGSSATRGQLGIGYNGRTFQERWVVVDTKALRPWEGSGRLRFHCNPDRPTVDCPTPLGHHRWEFPVRPGEDENELSSPASVWKVLAGQGITDADVEILRSVVYSHHVRVADRWRVGRIFLAGDAAHAMPPWIGQGMCSGVRDAVNLCWKLIDVIDGALPDSALDTYQLEREPHVRETTERATFVGRLITEHNHLLAGVRNRALRTIGKRALLRNTLVHAHWVPQPYFRAGLFADGAGKSGWDFLENLRHVSYLRSAGAQAKGRLFPQAEVTIADGTVVRLDSALGWGWRILTTEPEESLPNDAALSTIPGGLHVDAQDEVEPDTYRILPAGSPPRHGAVVDHTGTLTRWLNDHGAATVILRPDHFVWDAAPAGSWPVQPPLGAEPRLITPAPAPTTIPTAE